MHEVVDQPTPYKVIVIILLGDLFIRLLSLTVLHLADVLLASPVSCPITGCGVISVIIIEYDNVHPLVFEGDSLPYSAQSVFCNQLVQQCRDTVLQYLDYNQLIFLQFFSFLFKSLTQKFRNYLFCC